MSKTNPSHTQDERREAVARIIDPEAFASLQAHIANCLTKADGSPGMSLEEAKQTLGYENITKYRIGPALSKADAILEALSPREGATLEAGDVEWLETLRQAFAAIGSTVMTGRLDRILSALSHPVEAAEGWRPIETAPKDGTAVLVWSPQGDGWGLHTFLVQWLNDANRGERAVFSWCVPGSWQDEQGGHYTIDDATHWQPLPAAPASQGEG